MKKLLLALAVLTVAGSANAQWHHGHHGYYGHRNHYNGGWAPILGGAVLGAVVYDIYNRPVVIQQPPVVVQQPTTVYQQNCTAWVETQNPDGTITRTRTCAQ